MVSLWKLVMKCMAFELFMLELLPWATFADWKPVYPFFNLLR